MILFYRILSNLIYPIIIILILFRKFQKKEDPVRYTEKIFPSKFNVHVKKKSNLIWFHAASLGEFKSILPIIKELNKKTNNFEFLITTLTRSSSNLASEEIKKFRNVHHRFFPVDVNFVINSFLSQWKPKAIFLVDSEIWPNLIINSKKMLIPIALINARITKKTFNRWKLFRDIAKEIFSTFHLCLSSNYETENFLKELGAKNVFYTGNIKLIGELSHDKIENINNKTLQSVRFWFAASTHEGEEIFCLKTHKILKEKFGKIITIIAPRHIERAEKIQKLCTSLGFSNQIINKGDLILENKEIIIINSFGVLASYFKYAKSVFIGKSVLKKLDRDGGQNPIEAAKLGCKIYHGPYVYNFNDIYKTLNKNNISFEIDNFKKLADCLEKDLENKNKNPEIFSEFMSKLGEKTLTSNMDKINKFLFNEIEKT